MLNILFHFEFLLGQFLSMAS